MDFKKTDLKKLRESKGLTQLECSIKCGVSVNTWINWEKKAHGPSLESWLRLIEVFPEIGKEAEE